MKKTMNKEEIEEIVECLPQGRTPFCYFKDRYALMLIRFALSKSASKRQVCEAGYGRLLEKPVVKAVLGKSGNGVLSVEDCENYWPLDYRSYTLTLGKWGSNDRYWDQVSRRGYNLVLQLNFSLQHTYRYYQLVERFLYRPFENWSHPVSKGKQRTLAWSRMDIDLRHGEALIEEIQTDWLREAMSLRKQAEAGDSVLVCGKEIPSENIRAYVDNVLAPHTKTWDEAMLAATIWFLRKEIGVKRIFYHTHESGAALKRISYRKPPRSLYTVLPKRFCFKETGERPAMFEGHNKAGKPKEALRNARFQTMSWGNEK